MDAQAGAVQGGRVMWLIAFFFGWAIMGVVWIISDYHSPQYLEGYKDGLKDGIMKAVDEVIKEEE